MLLRAGCTSFFAKAPILLVINRYNASLLRYHFHSLNPVYSSIQCPNRFSMSKSTGLCTTTAAAFIREPSRSAAQLSNNRSKRKARRREAPEGVFKHNLDMCSKRGDLVEALRLYDDARTHGIPLAQHHYNILLYLCSCGGNGNGDSKVSKDVLNLGLERGFEIFKQMGVDKIAPNEATFTNLARLAVAKEDPEMAFDLVKQMKSCGIPPKLRSYGPALFGFCRKGMADKAFEVDAHMVESGVSAEEPEILALLKLSGEAKRAHRVYEMLHRLRATVRQVTDETALVVEDWFKSTMAAEVGEVNWDLEKVREGVVKGGGGWHGHGWLGNGNWRVVRTCLDEMGRCQSCGEKLVCIDIDPKETENFASSLTNLACGREVKADFMQFQIVLKGSRRIRSVVVDPQWEIRERDVLEYDILNRRSFMRDTGIGDFGWEVLGSHIGDLRIRGPRGWGLRPAVRSDSHGCQVSGRPKILEWLQKHGPFDAVVDGANVGLVNQHVFSFSLLNSVVNQLRQMSPSKRLPLVVLHKSRVTGGPAQNSNNRKLLEHWKKFGALYATPPGSNDDWYDLIS
ncbi:ribonuclease P [Sarracenia purpurea var. burkii]